MTNAFDAVHRLMENAVPSVFSGILRGCAGREVFIALRNSPIPVEWEPRFDWNHIRPGILDQTDVCGNADHERC